MPRPDPQSLIFDWAAAGPHGFAAPRPVTLNDETLRDGLQNPSVTDPPLDTKLRILHAMDGLGIEHASMGMPCAGPRHREVVERLCREIGDAGLRLRPNCGGRTLVGDVEAIVGVAQATGLKVEACLFVGSSPIRHYAEEWDLDEVLRNTRDAVGLAVREGLPVMFITEDTVRSDPEQLEVMLRAAVEAGASRVCLCDTVGAAVPHGTRNLVAWARALLDRWAPAVEIDWHGHRDRGLALANTLAAIEAGASRVHGTALGVGERVGNTSIEELLVNLQLLGLRDGDLSKLMDYVELVAAALQVDIPPGSPIVGRDAFRTATGVHAAAVLKARARGEDWVAERVYSAVPAGDLGRALQIEIGPLSGASNVVHFLRAHGRAEDPAAIAAVLRRAKASQRVLTAAEVLAVLDGKKGGR